MLPRRALLAALPACAAAAAPARGDTPRQLRIGTQKGEPVLMAARQDHGFEALLQPLGIEVRWVEFEFGPPMLEAMRAGAIDIGATGDAPPVFAQAAHAELVYIAARPDGGKSLGILLPPGSQLRTLADLRGQRVGFGRASSAHALTLAALEKAGIAYADIRPVALGPADAAAAFAHGDLDAWAVWDPYVAVTEARPGVRVLARSGDIGPANSFYLASRDFATNHGDILRLVVQQLGRAGAWCDAHRDAVAQLLAGATGISLEAWRLATGRGSFRTVPIDDAVLRQQQIVADRFAALRLIPGPVNVRDYAWRESS
jgi:NitT/TauT family transport system substrate-binding protein/sulfonate transport system substrate-binding protein